MAVAARPVITVHESWKYCQDCKAEGKCRQFICAKVHSSNNHTAAFSKLVSALSGEMIRLRDAALEDGVKKIKGHSDKRAVKLQNTAFERTTSDYHHVRIFCRNFNCSICQDIRNEFSNIPYPEILPAFQSTLAFPQIT